MISVILLIKIKLKEISEQNQVELNVVKCTNRSGLFEKLENIQSRLSLCEKALAEYLETKRLAFPRFVENP